MKTERQSSTILSIIGGKLFKIFWVNPNLGITHLRGKKATTMYNQNERVEVVERNKDGPLPVPAVL